MLKMQQCVEDVSFYEMTIWRHFIQIRSGDHLNLILLNNHNLMIIIVLLQ